MGCKIVLGSGGGQEDHFVSAVVASAEEEDNKEERDCGGSIVLETSVSRNHPKGEKVLPVQPGRAEAEAYKKRQVSAWRIASRGVGFLYPMESPCPFSSIGSVGDDPVNRTILLDLLTTTPLKYI